MRRLTDFALCVLAGVLTFAAHPTPLYPDWSFWPTIWISGVPLLWLLRDKSPRASFGWGLLCGTIVHGGGYYWISELLITFGHLPWPVAFLGYALHSVYQGLMFGIWAWLINRIGNTTPVPIQWSAPLAMVAIEFAIPRLFPAYMGNSQFPFPPMMQIVDLFGIGAVTFLIYRVNATLYLWLRAVTEGRTRPMKATYATLIMVVGTLAYGGIRIFEYDHRVAEAQTLRVGLVEGDIGIFERETREKKINHLLIQQKLSAELVEQGAELIVWPESAYRRKLIPRDAERLPPSPTPLVDDYEADVRQHTARSHRDAPQRGFTTPLIFGGGSYEPRPEPRFEGDVDWQAYNSAWLLDRDGNSHGRYDKVYLLMFGEYIPLTEYFPWIYELIPAAGDLEAGDRIEVFEADLWDKGPIRIGVMICYEGILAGFTRGLADRRPHFITNLTNDAWFGKTAELYLHFALTIPRAIENRVAFVRVTNTGVSAFVDPVGRIVKTTRPDDAETLMWDVPLLQSATVYQITGDVFFWACLLMTLGLYGWGRWRRR